MAVKEFITAVQEDREEDEFITFLHDGTEVTFFKPSSGQMTILLTLMSGDIKVKQMSTIVNLFIEMADDDTQRYFEDRLLNRHDSFDFGVEGGVMDIVEYLMEEWSARPTERPRTSGASRRTTGQRSTAPTRAKGSTSSPSRRRASSTSSASGQSKE